MAYRLRDENKKIRDMFSRISRRYDFLNRLLSLGFDVRWRKRAVSFVYPREGGTHLDLACGTGDVSLEIFRQVASPRVVGGDVSMEMLKLAREKMERRKISDGFTAVACVGEELPFRDGCFDTVSIAFGIRNIVERERALREMRRTLKPGGLLIILEFSLPRSPLFRTLYLFYFTKLLPFLGGLFSEKGAYDYLPASVIDFPPPEEFEKVILSCGFTRVRRESLTGGIVTLYVAEK
ncbi:MAG: bifunctional demethylmenaquinone methyltransferase/2-methoxy-6-polyprenyl-1,4-benzoquinol methylase UbiE [Deltaproteobacteria bacterium]|nr:MAG: bifunctional demethylmenaquinone methyltransferase/2-methoxy-6-polyprenyl-1,4-benzoquinol methylase UbiE [Deltaproteobacteria bacterium]